MSRYYESGSGFRRSKPHDDSDPLSSMANMGDIMLVFACGLMVALVVAWNVDLGRFQQVEMDQEIKQDQIEQITEQLYGEGGAFIERGRVYQDPTTGKYYLVENADESSASASGTSGQDDSADTSSSTSTEANGE